MIISPCRHNWVQDVLSGSDGAPVCLVVVVDVKGSAPRETGAVMVVFVNHIRGSIGGGELEYQAMETARSHQPKAGFERQLRSYPLGPALGQCCGGHVKLMFEWYSPKSLAVLKELASRNDGFSLHHTSSQELPAVLNKRPDKVGEGGCLLALTDRVCDVFIYGAGHVGRAVVELAHHLSCQIYWVDVDEDRYPEAIPPEVIKLPARSPQTIAARAPAEAIHLVMSYSHKLDYDIVAVLLGSGHFGKCGLIGSATKAARFKTRLQSSGISLDRIDQLVCPIGLQEVTGKAPLQVALSVTAQLSNWLDQEWPE